MSNNLVSIRDFTENDIGLKIVWINDPENNGYLHYDIPLTYTKTLNWFRNRDCSKRRDCIIEYDSVPVGVIGLLSIDTINSKAEFYITVGEKKYKRMGIATQATSMMLDYAFSVIGLNKVYLNVDADNEAACGLYESTGFLCEGLFIEDLKRNGSFINRKRYALLNKNWHKDCINE